MQPQGPQTREQIETRTVVLRIPDTTEVDLSHHPTTKGLGKARQLAVTRTVCANGPGGLARNG
jgi:hypothetical protein